jgi:hypothetical protein
VRLAGGLDPWTDGERHQVAAGDTCVIGDLDDDQVRGQVSAGVGIERAEVDRIDQPDPCDPPPFPPVPAPPLDQVDRQRRFDRRVQSLIMTCLTTV